MAVHEANTARAAVSVRGALTKDGPLVALCFGLVALGVTLRFVHLGVPSTMKWDEHHFALNARNYIQGLPDWNDHPPLGKLLMVPGMLLFGDNAVGWRTGPLVCGLLNVLLAGCLGTRLYRDRRAGWLAAAFVAADGFLIAYSRTALLDGMLTTFLLAAVWLTVRARTPRGVAAAAIAIGLAASIKMSAFAFGLPVALLCLGKQRRVESIASLALAPVVYTLVFMAGLALTHEPHSSRAAWKKTFELLAHHNAETSFRHPLTSHWYTWFLPKRPVTLFYEAMGPRSVVALTTLGNLALWWAAAAALLLSGSAAVQASNAVIRARSLHVTLGRAVRADTVLFAFALTMLLPWIIGRRDSYIYHYLPTYSLLLVVVAGMVSRVYRRERFAALAFVSLVTVVAAFYAPVWGQLPLSEAGFQSRLFVPSWR